MTGLVRLRRTIGQNITALLIRLLARSPLTPNMLTWTGILLAFITAAIIIRGNLIAAGLMIIFSSAFDMLDGALARATNRVTRYGAVLDATIDRLSETILLTGTLALFLFSGDTAGYFTLIDRTWSIIIVAVALGTFPLPAYIRARADAAGIDCQVGIFTRPERVVLLAIGFLVNQIPPALAIITLLNLVTAGQRLFYVQRHLRD
jgi:phosphatidylglycerophosphate synthase